MPWGKLSEDERVRQQIEVAPDAALADPEGAGDLGTVPDLGVVVRHHRPEAAKRLSRNADAELREVALQKRLQERAPPLDALRLTWGQERARESAAEPKAVEGAGADLVKGKAVETVIADPAGQRFGGPDGGSARSWPAVYLENPPPSGGISRQPGLVGPREGPNFDRKMRIAAGLGRDLPFLYI